MMHRSRSHGPLPLVAAALLFAPPAVAAPAASDSDANSARAQSVEKLAMQIMQTPAMLAARAKALSDFKANEVASKPDALRYIQSATDEAARYAALQAAMGSLKEPAFSWSAATPHKWGGYTFPGTRWFADNTDTLYRSFRTTPGARYEITVRPAKTLPAQMSFLVYDWLMLEDGKGAQSDVPLSAIEITEATPRNPDGSITLIAGPEPANGRANYLELKPGAKQVYVREIRGDGSLPAVRLSVRRIGGGPPPDLSLHERGVEAANYLAAGVNATNNVTKIFGDLTENALAPVRVRWAEGAGGADKKMITDEVLRPDQAVGFISSGLFNLKEDEALVMTLKMMGTKYLSINTYRPYLVSPEHVYGSSSLNNFQTRPNPDGSISFVLARKDPGVHNWLDVGGIPYGFIAVRWQGLTRPVAGTSKNGIDTVKVVKLADLRRELPAGTAWITPSQREAQRQERARQYKLRCLGTPCEAGGALDRPY